jgi:predicted nucleic acid-binding protein
VKFWDTSAFVPLLIDQGLSETLRKLAESDPSIAVWWGTRVEVISALSRLEREGALDAKGVNEVAGAMLALIRHGLEMEPSEAIRDTAIRILRTHPLRAADAFRLAAALHAAEAMPATMDFVCTDAKLALAASKEGFRILP